MNKLSITVLSALALFGIAFPATVALANRPVPAPSALVAPSGDAVLGAVTVVETDEGSHAVVLDEVVVAPAARKPAARTQGCKRIVLEQQGRPGAQTVLMCG